MSTYLEFKDQRAKLSAVFDTVKMEEKIAASLLQKLVAGNTEAREGIIMIKETLSRLYLFYENHNHPLIKHSLVGKKVLIICTGEKGLVGDLWRSVAAMGIQKRKSYDSIISIGKEGTRFLIENNVNLYSDVPEMKDVKGGIAVGELLEFLISELYKQSVSSIDVVYPQFISLLIQRPFIQEFLPFDPSVFKTGDSEDLGIPIFEPNRMHIFEELLQLYLKASLSQIFKETQLSGFAAKMIAMERAGTKTKNEINKLDTQYHKDRRENLTNRQLTSFAIHRTL